MDFEVKFTADELLSDELFEQIFAEPDPIQRNRLIARIRMRARELKMLRDWDALLKAYQDEFVQMKRRLGNDSTANFTDCPIEGEFLTGKWKADDTGIYRIANEGNIFGNESKIIACPHPILPVERLVNIDSGREKISLSFYKDKKWSKITVDRSTVASRSKIVDLSSLGIEVTSETAKELVTYIADCVSLNPDKIPNVRSVSHMGWTEDGFAPYSGVKFDGDEGMRPLFQAITQKGELEEWTKYVGNLRRKSKLLRIQMAAAFASPLLKICNAPCFIFHLWGGTGAGKTVGMMVSMSIWGDPHIGKLVRKMDNTAANFGTVSGFLYSLPFAGDELQEIKNPIDGYDKLVMKVCMGSERGRNVSGNAVAETKTWENVFLFTGEDSILRSQSGGGVYNRVISVDVGESKIITDGPEVLDFVYNHFGAAGKPFIDAVDKYRDNLPDGLKKLVTQAVSEADTTDKQAIPAALMVLADGIATRLFWPDDDPLTIRDFYPYLSTKDDVDIALRAYDWTINWIGANVSRFIKKDGEDVIAPVNGEIWGKLNLDTAFINRSILEREWQNQGFDYTAISKQLVNKGLILRNNQGVNTHPTRLSGTLVRCVKLKLPDDTVGIDEDIDF